jgi:pimeloyl-ACP methyl ester carboxylesterase
LANEAELVAIDLRGHGGTPWDPDKHYGFADLVEDLKLQLEHWSVRSFLVGYGLGGHLATAVATELKGTIAGLILIEMDPAGESTQTLLERLEEARRSEGSYSAAFTSTHWRTVYEQLTWATPGAGRRPKCDPAVLAKRDAPSQWERLKSIRIPALVLRGGASTGVPSTTAARLAQTLPMATYREVDGGIWPHIESPGSTANAVRLFLREQDAA